jgi:hypothetical protein
MIIPVSQANRIECTRRVVEKTIHKRSLESKPRGRRIRGRPRKRWIEDIEGDIQSMGIRGWRKLSKERTE